MTKETGVVDLSIHNPRSHHLIDWMQASSYLLIAQKNVWEDQSHLHPGVSHCDVMLRCLNGNPEICIIFVQRHPYSSVSRTSRTLAQ